MQLKLCVVGATLTTAVMVGETPTMAMMASGDTNHGKSTAPGGAGAVWMFQTIG